MISHFKFLQDIVKIACEANADYTQFPKDWLFHLRWSKGSGITPKYGPHSFPVSFVTVAGRTSAVVLKLQPKKG